MFKGHPKLPLSKLLTLLDSGAVVWLGPCWGAGVAGAGVTGGATFLAPPPKPARALDISAPAAAPGLAWLGLTGAGWVREAGVTAWVTAGVTAGAAVGFWALSAVVCTGALSRIKWIKSHVKSLYSEIRFQHRSFIFSFDVKLIF